MISVVIPLESDASFAINSCSSHVPIEILLITKDKSLVKHNWGEVSVVQQEESQSVYSAALESARFEYLLFLDESSQLVPGALDELAAILQRTGVASICFGKASYRRPAEHMLEYRVSEYSGKLVHVRSPLNKRYISRLDWLLDERYTRSLPLPSSSVFSKHALSRVPEIGAGELSVCFALLDQVQSAYLLDKPLVFEREMEEEALYKKLSFLRRLVKLSRVYELPVFSPGKYLSRLYSRVAPDKEVLEELTAIGEAFGAESLEILPDSGAQQQACSWVSLRHSEKLSDIEFEFSDNDFFIEAYSSCPDVMLEEETSRWSGETLKSRQYEDYADYLAHQRNKLEDELAVGSSLWLTEYHKTYPKVLEERLSDTQLVRRGMSALCLAARIGTEVQAFLKLGCFAIGLDLNPGPENKLVVSGDFHSIQFPDDSVDIVFTNSLDHSLELDKVLAEVHRVLKPEGHFIVEAVCGVKEGFATGRYESFSWEQIDDLVESFENCGFKVLRRIAIEYPWRGDQICLEKRKRSGAA